MIRHLEDNLAHQVSLIENPLVPSESPTSSQEQREQMINERLIHCQRRLNRIIGRGVTGAVPEMSSVPHDGVLRLRSRDVLSGILETFTRFFDQSGVTNIQHSIRYVT